jgi:hypothetical protein
MRHQRADRRALRAAFAAALLAAVAALGFAPVSASAQTVGDIPYIDAVDAWADGQSLRRTLPGSGDGAITQPSKPRRGNRPNGATARQLASLRFERSEEVTRQNDQAVMALLEPGYDPAAVVAEFDRLRAVVHDGIEGWKGRWSPSNIADVAAYMLLSSYSVYYAKPSVSERGSLAVRSVARNSMALNRQIRRLSDARKQTAADMLELRTIFRLSDINVARMEGDATSEQTAKAQLRAWIKDAFGIDLERVRLTRKGLVPR